MAIVIASAFAMSAFSLSAQAPAATNNLGSVHIPRGVMADGEPLAAGTYTVRISPATVDPVVGESADGSRWVEFVQGQAVKGRELATVLSGPDVKAVAKEAPPAAGHARVELLLGGHYLRVWINHGGTQYLVHLVVPGTAGKPGH